jgi:hypothetical protein
MLKRITFRAEDSLIDRARRRAKDKRTTLNAEFQRWLVRNVDTSQSVTELEELIKTFGYAKRGNNVSRDEMNHR